jgi:hypothetical protein
VVFPEAAGLFSVRKIPDLLASAQRVSGKQANAPFINGGCLFALSSKTRGVPEKGWFALWNSNARKRSGPAGEGTAKTNQP